MTRPLVFAGFLALAACSSPADDTAVQVDQVTFSPGCGVKPESDCAYGFVLSYVKNHANVAVSHVTDNAAHTVDITVEGQGSGADMSHADADLGLLDVKLGQTYAVTVFDAKHAVLWTGSVDALYHL
jgi:hypothetical protein